ncbi:MAG TPA: DNA repair exonuclease [Thermodesulfobacteriota bacterium]|nr:DNA repair exonuclease [Thermodesulfobacteriota bacterium]
MASFSFIHTADIHLDSPLRGLEGMEGAAVERIRTATRKAFANLVTEAVEREVDFVVIAGDLYDGDWRDYRTGLFFVAQMGRLAGAGIQAFILYGNHDAESRITRRLTLPDNVKVFSAKKPETFRLEDIGAALHGQGYHTRDVRENLAALYPDPVPGAFNIGVLHTGMGGMGGHENYAPCAVGELVARGYDYWALGHVHQGSVVHERPHIVFPGNIQGRHIRETGPKGGRLITVEDNEIISFEPLRTDVVRWEILRVNVEGCERMSDAVECVRSAIEEAINSRADGRMLACRIELGGAAAIHESLLVSGEHILAEARAVAHGFGEEAAWIERVVVSTEPLRGEDADAGEIPGGLHDILGAAAADTDLHKLLRTDLGDMISKLPSDLRNSVDDTVLSAALGADYSALAEHAREYLSALLKARKD